MFENTDNLKNIIDLGLSEKVVVPELTKEERRKRVGEFKEEYELIKDLEFAKNKTFKSE
jgi:hypothetical protein